MINLDELIEKSTELRRVLDKQELVLGDLLKSLEAYNAFLEKQLNG